MEHKNYDYRYAWVRDAGYTIKAFLTAGLQAEAKAALTWLLNQLRHAGTRVLYTLDGDAVADVKEQDGGRLSGFEARGPRQRGHHPVAARRLRRHLRDGIVLREWRQHPGRRQRRAALAPGRRMRRPLAHTGRRHVGVAGRAALHDVEDQLLAGADTRGRAGRPGPACRPPAASAGRASANASRSGSKPGAGPKRSRPS